MSDIVTRAWRWVDTASAVTSKFTLVRFGEGILSDGTTETPFVYGEALIDEPVSQQYATFSGPRVGRPSVAPRVDVVFYGTGQAPESALIDRSMCTLTATGFSVSGMFLSGVTAGVTWRARAVAGGTAVVGVEARIGPPPERGKGGSMSDIGARWETLKAGGASRLAPALASFEALRRLPRRPRALRRLLRHLVRPPMRGYWTRRAGR